MTSLLYRALGCAGIAAMLAGCAASVPSPGVALNVANGDFEADWPPGSNCARDWGCVMHADPTSFRFFLDEKAPASGKRSFCIEPITNQPYGKAVQTRDDFNTWRNMRVRLSMAVKVEEVKGDGAGVFIVAHDGGGMAARPRSQFVRYSQKLVKGSAGWQRVETELVIPPDTFILEFGAILQGAGRACVDDVRLEFLQVPKSPV
jgi:hypothetical protein